MGALIFAAVVVGLFLFIVGLYNGLIRSRNEMKNSFAQIDVQLKRRYDLVPNLVESVRGVMAHERDTLEAVIQARNQAVPALKEAMAHPENAAAIQKMGQVESNLSMALGRLFALSESYPALQAQESVKSLMEELASTENRIGFARQAFNDSVMTFNTKRESFPAVLFAASMGFQAASSWEITNPADRENVKVDLTRR